jgi:carbon storage regulator CsrA
MNYFSLCQGESLHIRENITVTLLDIDGDYVVLQIDSPEGTQVERRELAAWDLVGSAACG